jgi:23S rRNA pseudouridine2604 synthase
LHSNFGIKESVNIRLNKFISDAGLCSRREADRKIEHGKVRVNGRVAGLGDLVNEDDLVLVDGNPVRTRLQRVYLAYNKPVGVTSTTERSDPDNIVKAVGYHGGRVFPVGRLDKESQGLILLTNDGDVVNKILRVSNAHDKEYIVSVDRPVTDEFVHQMASGVNILGVTTRSCEVERLDRQVFRIVLKQGLNRQIRRMCKVLGYKVLKLERVRIMHIGIRGIGSGSWRFLTDDEQETLLAAVGHSTNAPAGSATKERPSVRRKPRPVGQSRGTTYAKSGRNRDGQSSNAEGDTRSEKSGGRTGSGTGTGTGTRATGLKRAKPVGSGLGSRPAGKSGENRHPGGSVPSAPSKSGRKNDLGRGNRNRKPGVTSSRSKR